MEDDGPIIQPGLDDKAREARFLVDEFDIPPTKAAGVVCQSENEALEVASRVVTQVKAEDPLADVPIPDPQRDQDHRETHSSELEKPVLHRKADEASVL